MIAELKKPKVKTKHACSLWGEKEATDFFKIPEMPTQDGIFPNSLSQALEVLKGDIILSYCYSCGDVGCGEGYFLSQICKKGDNFGLGIDPGFNHENLVEGKNEHVSFIRDYYSKSYAHLKADFLICRLLVDLLHDPFSFLQSIRSNLETQMETIVYFEVPNTDYNLDELCIWNLVYEHKSWYTPESLSYFFELCGFEVLDIYPCWKNEFLAIEAKPSEISRPSSPKLRKELEEKISQQLPKYI